MACIFSIVNHCIIYFWALGYSGLGFCLEGSTATTTKTHDTPASSSRYSNPMLMALLCCRWKFMLRGNMENSHDTSKITTTVSTVFHYFLSIYGFKNDFSTSLCIRKTSYPITGTDTPANCNKVEHDKIWKHFGKLKQERKNFENLPTSMGVTF